MSENEYIIDTSLDSSGVVKGAQEINKALDDSTKHAESASKSIADVNKSLYKLTPPDLKDTEIALEKIGEQYVNVNAYTKEQIEAMREQARLADQIASTPQARPVEETQQPARTTIRVNTEGATDFTKQTDDLEQNATRIKSIKDRIVLALDAIAEGFYKSGTANGEMLGNTFNALAGTVDNFGKTTKRVFSSIAGGAVKGAVKGVKLLASAFIQAHQSVQKFKQSNKMLNGGLQGSFKTFLKYGLGIRSIFVLVNRLRNAIKEGFTNLAKFDKDTNASISSVTSALATLKNALATAFAPILSVVAPILTTFINKLVDVANAIGAVLAKLTGKSSYAKAIAVQKDFAASLDKTGKSAKGQTLAIDELNQSVDESESGGGGGGAGSMFENTDISEAQSQMADWLKSMWENADFTEMGTALGSKLADGLDKIPWGGIKKKAANIGKSIATLINGFVEVPDLGKKVGTTYAQAYNTAFTFLYSFVEALHWESIGAFIADGLTGFIENIDLGKLTGTISGVVKGLFDAFTGFIKGVDWQSLPILLKDKFVSAVKGVDWGGVASSIAKALGAAIASVGELLVGIGQLVLDIVSSIRNYFADYIDEYINQKGEKSLGWAIINGVWNGILDALKNVGKWIYDNIFKPFIDGFKEAFKIHSPSKVMEEQGNFIVEGLYNGLVGVWNRVKGIFEGLKTSIVNKTTEIKNSTKQKFTEMKDNVVTVVSALKTNATDKFTNMKDSLVSVASKTKDGVYNSFNELKNVIRTPMNAILGFAEKFANGVVSAVNKVISALNGLKIDVPDWVTEQFGIKSFGFSIPSLSTVSIPRLATGTVIPRQSREFAAILGDNNRETEVVSPLSTIQEAVAETLTPYLAEIARNTEKFLEKDFATYLGDREVAKASLRGQKQLGFQISH